MSLIHNNIQENSIYKYSDKSLYNLEILGLFAGKQAKRRVIESRKTYSQKENISVYGSRFDSYGEKILNSIFETMHQNKFIRTYIGGFEE
jgi:hypothetical protein